LGVGIFRDPERSQTHDPAQDARLSKDRSPVDTTADYGMGLVPIFCLCFLLFLKNAASGRTLFAFRGQDDRKGIPDPWN